MYFFLDWFQGFDDSSNSKIVVVFRAIESTNDEIDYAKMVLIRLLLSLSYLCSFFFLCLKSLHDLLSFFIFIHHDVTHTQIGNHNSCETKHIVGIFVDNWFIVSDSFVVPLKDKENMSHVEFPGFMICTKLGTLSEQFLNNSIVLFIPVDLCLRH